MKSPPKPSSKKPTDSHAPRDRKVSKRAKKKEQVVSKGIYRLPLNVKTIAHAKEIRNEGHDSAAEENDNLSEEDKKTRPPQKKISKKQVASTSKGSKKKRKLPLEVDPKSSKAIKIPSKPRSKPAVEDDALSSGSSLEKPIGSPAPRDGKVSSKRAKTKEQTEKQLASVKPVVSQSEDESDSQFNEIPQLLVEEKKKKNGESSSKKPLIERLWSEEDVNTILKGLIRYAGKKGVDPATADINAFYDYIRESLQIEASKSQLQEKIRRLKKKYQTNLLKGRNGIDKKFSQAHDENVYELSKKIWGTECRMGKRAEVKVKIVLENMEEEEHEDINERQNKLMQKEIEVFLQKLDIIRNRAALELEVLLGRS